MKSYTMVEIADRLEEAVRTLRRLPEVVVPGYFSTWPDVIHSAQEIFQIKKERRRLGPPSAIAISEMEEAIQWILLLDDEAERRLVWMRAGRVPWKIICRRFGCCRTTAYHQWRIALLMVATALNVGERRSSDVRTSNR